MRTVTFSAVKLRRICAGTGRTVALVLMILAIGFLGSRSLNAQQDLGYILGTVSDQQGAAVVGAKVTITFTTTGLSQTVNTNETGFYTSRPLQVGHWSITVEKAGFSKSTVPDIIVDAAAKVQANVTLQVGAATTNVTVEAMPSLINTTDAIVGATIDNRAAEQLPVNGRSVLALATLSPGVSSAMGAVSEGFQNRGTFVSDIRISGGVVGMNNNILDGVSNMQDWLGEVAINLKSDSVHEYRILSGIVPAQFGYTSGGVIDIVSRSGGNKIHGSAYEFLRNDALDAESSFPRPIYGKAELRFNNYGGTLGGPILRDRLFIFGNYEQYNYVSKYPSYYTVATEQEHGGDFSDLGQLVNGVCQPVNIYDADTVDSNGIRQQFSDGGIANKIPNNRLDPVAVAYQSLFYLKPNNASGGYDSCSHANNYLAQEPVLANERQGIVRGDFKLSDKDNFVGRYAYYLNHNNNGSNAGSTSTYYNPFSARVDILQTQSATLGEVHTFSPSLLNDARLGLLIGDFSFNGSTVNEGIADKVGLPNSNPLGAPYMNNGMPAPNSTYGFRASSTVELLDDVTWMVKNHTIHVGASARWTEGFNNQTGSSPSGNFTFSSATTALNNSATTVVSGTGNTYASYLLGQVTTGSALVQYGSAYRRMLYAGYVQDDWRVSPKLTLNLGIRYDLMTQAVEKHDGIQNFDITQKNPVYPQFAGLVQYAATDGYGRNFVHENFGDWGPRLGFAYTLPGNKTILRGGMAIYYPSVSSYNYDYASGNSTGYGSMTTTWSATVANYYLFNLKNGLPGQWNQPLGAKGGPNAFLGQSAAYMAPYAKDPTSQVLNLTVSRDLGWGIVVDATWAGNHGNHFVNYAPNLNFLDPQYYHLGTKALSTAVTNPYKGLPGMQGTLGTATTITEKQALLPYPYMSGVSVQYPRIGYYWANLGMLSVQRRAESGLAVMGAYTFGKITDAGVQGVADLAGGGATGSSASPQNPYNPKGDHSVDTIDVTHRASVSVLYDLPLGRNKRFLNSGGKLDRLASGWQVGMILTFESGRPLGISGANNQLGGRPNLNPNMSYKVSHLDRASLYTTGHLEWFNPNGFLNPADYTFGSVSRMMSDLRGPGVANVDLSAFKTTHITEGVTFEFRIEGYNAFNHPNLPGPSTGFSAGSAIDPNNPYAGGQLNTSSTFGMITSGATTTRNVQLGGKIFF